MQNFIIFDKQTFTHLVFEEIELNQLKGIEDQFLIVIRNSY